MLAGVPVSSDSVAELAHIVRTTGDRKLADRLERPLRDVLPQSIRTHAPIQEPACLTPFSPSERLGPDPIKCGLSHVREGR